MDWQIIFNIGCGIALSVAGWFARELWDSVQALKRDVQKIEVDLPMNYVRKIDLEVRFDKLEATLQRILDKLDQKADK